MKRSAVALSTKWNQKTPRVETRALSAETEFVREGKQALRP
jgi:hypothetical protein